MGGLHIELPRLYPAQYRAINGHLMGEDGRRKVNDAGEKLRPARMVLIEGSTKCGKTAGMLAWQLERVARDATQGEHWWVAPVYGQAEIAFRRAKRFFRLSDGSMPDGVRTHDTGMWIELPNGARWSFKSGEKPDNIFGEDVRSAVIDEASRVREESWHAVRSTLTKTRGPVRIIGNVKGRGNWFYKLCRRAQAEQSEEIAYYKLTAYDAVEGGVLDPDEIESAKRDLPEHVFRELYLAEPADDVGNPFGYAKIASCIAPISNGRPWVWGVDLAKSEDYTVCIALDRDGHVCRFHRWKNLPWDETADRVQQITAGVPGLIDSTGVGAAVYDIIAGRTQLDPFMFTSSSKQELMGQLKAAVQRGIIRFPDGEIREEMEAFEYSYSRTHVSYSAPVGYHDDTVCALALAVRAGMVYGLGQQGSAVVPVAAPSGRRGRFAGLA